MSGTIHIDQLESRMRDNPKSLLFAHLADLYLRDGRIDDAVHLCQEGLKHNAAYVTGHFVLAKAYLAQGETDKAEESLKTVLTHDRQFLAAHKMLGDLMARGGWENKAAVHYRDLVQIDPLETEAREMLESMAPEEPFLGDFATHQVGAESLDLEPAPTPLPVQEEWEEELLPPASEPDALSLDVDAEETGIGIIDVYDISLMIGNDDPDLHAVHKALEESWLPDQRATVLELRR